MTQEVNRPIGVFVGLTVLDLVHHVDAPPGPNEKITANRQFLAAGGPAANAAVTFAALGGKARLFTALGNSAPALVARQDLEAHGVEIIDFAPPGFEISVSAVAVTSETGDRSVISMDAGTTPVGAVDVQVLKENNPTLWASGIRTLGLDQLLEPAHVLLVDGHHPELALAALEFYQAPSRAELCSETQIPRSFTEQPSNLGWSSKENSANQAPNTPANVGQGFMTERIMDAGRWKPHLEGLLPHTDTVICSADFSSPPTLPSLPSIQTDLLLPTALFKGPQFARTGGDRPINWWHRDTSDTQTRGSVSPPQVTAVDTLGAGDVFHGAYAFYAAVANAQREAGVTGPADSTATGQPSSEAREAAEETRRLNLAQTGANFAELLEQASRIAAFRVQHLGPRNWIEDLPLWLGRKSRE